MTSIWNELKGNAEFGGNFLAVAERDVGVIIGMEDGGFSSIAADGVPVEVETAAECLVGIVEFDRTHAC